MSEIQVNTINEYTGASGVTIDGVLLKDGEVDGVDVSAIVSGSLVKLSSATASNSSELVFDNFVDTSTYAYYKIYAENIVAATNGTFLRMTFRQGGASGSDIAGSYYGMQWASFGNQAVAGFDSNFSQSGYGEISNGLPNSAGLFVHKIWVDYFPCDGTNGGSSYWAKMIGEGSNGLIDARIRARHLDSLTAATGARFYMSSGNITSGTIYIYGVKK
jgi:hypothetical protein